MPLNGFDLIQVFSPNDESNTTAILAVNVICRALYVAIFGNLFVCY